METTVHNVTRIRVTQEGRGWERSYRIRRVRIDTAKGEVLTIVLFSDAPVEVETVDYEGILIF